MFLVCDKVMNLCRLLFSWSYHQENDTLPIDFLGGSQILLHLSGCQTAKVFTRFKILVSGLHDSKGEIQIYYQ